MGKPSKQPIDPMQFFFAALGFRDSQRILFEGLKAGKSQLWRPIITASSFSSELFYKCFLALDGKPNPWHHDLSEMHQNLAPASRKEIEKRWDDAIAASSDIFDAFEKHGRDPKFRQLKHCLGNGALAFEVLRYPGRESESGFALFPLPDVLHSAIVARRPDWSIVFHPHAISIEPENNTAGDSAARNVIDNKAALDSGVFNPADIPNASITKEMEDFYAFVRAEIMAGKTVVDNKG